MEYACGDSLKWQGVIQKVENLSKLNPWSPDAEKDERTLDKATYGQQAIGRALVKIENHIKQMNSLGAVVRSLEHAGFWVDPHGDSVTRMKKAAHEIEQRVEQWHFRFQDLKERGKNQLNVVSHGPECILKCC